VAAEQKQKQADHDLDVQRYLIQQAAQQEEARHNQEVESIAANKRPEGYIDPAINQRVYQTLPQEIKNRIQYSDYVDMRKLAEAYGRGEIGQANQVQMHVMFPPQGNTSIDNLTRAQSLSIARQQAEAQVRQAVHGAAEQMRALGPSDYVAMSRQSGGAITPYEAASYAQDEYRKMDRAGETTRTVHVSRRVPGDSVP
jgi:hypothetical protein